MGAGTVSAPLLTGRRAEPAGRGARLLAAGCDRNRLESLASDLSALGYACRIQLVHEEVNRDAAWDAVIIDLRAATSEVIAFCQRGRKEGALGSTPLVFVVELGQLPELHLREGLFDDFVEVPYTLPGLDARLHLARWRSRRSTPDALTIGELVLEPLSYRAMLRGVPLELAYMEFELLKFLLSHPGRVFTRQTLLNRVWGYEYFGVVRTVDVHIRRLRAKLGEEHARYIETVRGVGYRLADA